MANTNELLELQRHRFTTILDLLKNKGISQRKIIDQLDLDFIRDETYFSNLKSGKRKYIPDELLDALNDVYHVNPEYIRLKSDYPFDITGTKLENFEKFVDTWDVVKRDEDKYLHLTIDRNFYDFLIEAYRTKEVAAEGLFSYETQLKSLKELYLSNPSPEEFVLLPRNSFYDIVYNDVESARYISEILDFSKFESYLDEDSYIVTKEPQSNEQQASLDTPEI